MDHTEASTIESLSVLRSRSLCSDQLLKWQYTCHCAGEQAIWTRAVLAVTCPISGTRSMALPLQSLI